MANRKGNEFSRKIKGAGYERSKRIDGEPRCDGCQCKLIGSKFTYDHIKTVEEGGKGTLENLQLLCPSCDRTKTYGQDIPRIRKGDRQRDGHSGASDRLTKLSGPTPAEKRAITKARSAMSGKIPPPGPRLPPGFVSAAPHDRRTQ